MLLFSVDGKSEACLGESVVLGVFEQIVGEEPVDFPDFEQTDVGAGEQAEAVVLHLRTDGFHVLMSQTAGNSEKIMLVADGVGRAEVGQLQGVGDGIILDRVVCGVGVYEVAVPIKNVVQVVIGEMDGVIVEVESVAKSAEITVFFVFDVVVVGDLERVCVDPGLSVAEHNGETGQVISDGRIMSWVAFGEVGAVFQTAVLRKFAVIQNVSKEETVSFFRGLIPQTCIKGQLVDFLVYEIALVACRIQIDNEIDLPDALGMCCFNVESGKKGIGEIQIGVGRVDIIDFQV